MGAVALVNRAPIHESGTYDEQMDRGMEAGLMITVGAGAGARELPSCDASE